MSVLSSLTRYFWPLAASTANGSAYPHGKMYAVMPRAACNSRGRSNLFGRSDVVSVPPTGRTCTRCGEWKQAEHFSVNDPVSGRLHSHCKRCVAEKNNARYHANPVPLLAKQREYNATEARRRASAEYNRQYREANAERLREQGKARREATRDLRREKRRQEYLADPRRAIEAAKRWRSLNPERYRAARKAWKRANRHLIAAIARNRRAQKLVGGGSITDQEWQALCARYGNRCLACERDDLPLTLDHIVPLSRGGGHYLSNAQPLCKLCNSSKGTRIIDYRPDRGVVH